MRPPKEKRLTKQEFDRFFRDGSRMRGTYVDLITHPSPTFHGAVVVGKKVYKSAVERNRLRRRLYGVLYRQALDADSVGVHIILTKPRAKEVPYELVKQELRELLGRIKKEG